MTLELTVFHGLTARALFYCRVSREAEEAGDLERARASLADFWSRVGERPRLEGLEREAEAEVLLRVGTLTGKIGSAKQITGAQALAKDLISESVTLFTELRLIDRVGEAETNMAYCYLREGRYDDARIILQDALIKLEGQNVELRARARLLLAYVEKEAKRLRDALTLHHSTAQEIDSIDNHHLRGVFHNEYATVLKNLGFAEGRGDYLDKALLEFTAADFHFEQSGNIGYRAAAINNLGFLYVGIGEFAKAHEQLSRARDLYQGLKEIGRIAQVDETRARAYLGQRNNLEALKTIKAAVRTLERGDESALLAEALTTYGTCLARVNDAEQAESVFIKAASVAREAGDGEGAGRAWLAMLEELPGLPSAQRRQAYSEALALLSDSQDASIKNRLLRVSGRVINDMRAKKAKRGRGDGAEFPAGFTLAEAKRQFEKSCVERAMRACEGNALRAAKLLGLKNHQRIYQLLNEHGLNALQSRRHQRSVIAPQARPKVEAIGEMLRIDLPDDLRGLPLTTHLMTNGALNSLGVQAGDEIVVWKTSAVGLGDLVGASVSGYPYMVGELRLVGDCFRLECDDEDTCSVDFRQNELKVEGKVVGFCKGEDVASAKPGVALRFYPIM